ncbi:MAG: leucine-rich repeat domain-containing protein [Polyangiaceae bacterium]
MACGADDTSNHAGAGGQQSTTGGRNAGGGPVIVAGGTRNDTGAGGGGVSTPVNVGGATSATSGGLGGGGSAGAPDGGATSDGGTNSGGISSGGGSANGGGITSEGGTNSGGDGGAGGGAGTGDGGDEQCSLPTTLRCVFDGDTCTSDEQCPHTMVCDGGCRPAPAFGEPCTSDWRCGDPAPGHTRAVCDQFAKVCVPPYEFPLRCISSNQCDDANVCRIVLGGQLQCATPTSTSQQVTSKWGDNCSFYACQSGLHCAQSPPLIPVAAPASTTPVPTSGSPNCDGPLAFPNKALETMVRNTIGIRGRDLTASDVSTLTTLRYLGDSQIGELYGIECLRNLRTLELEGVAIRDSSRIAGLTNLASLSVRLTSVKDLGPLSGLTNLKSLSVTDSLVESVAPLSSLTGLTSLNLARNHIADVLPLRQLQALVSLDFEQ